MRLLICLIVATFGVRTAHAEIIVVRGVELKVPADWVQEAKKSTTLIRPKNYKGRALEVIEVPAMPADAEAFKKLLGGAEKLEITSVKELPRDGVKLLTASGKFTGGKTPITVDIVAVPVNGKAVLLMSAVGTDQDPIIRKANAEILLSARIPGARLTSAYVAGKKTVGPPKDFVEIMTKVIAVIDKNTRLPRPLPVTFMECGEINAFYKPGAHTITMCHDLYDDLVALFKRTGSDEKKANELARGTLFFTFFHEFGHALVGELGLPITGKGEDAADEIATLVMVQLGTAGWKSALAAAQWFDTMSKDKNHKNVFWDSHSFDEQRVVTITCLLYGANQEKFADLMKSLKIPPARLGKCVRDYPARKKAWDTMLAPYTMKT